MDTQDRPPLGKYAYEELAKALHEIDQTHWDQLSELRVTRPYSLVGPTPDSPTPPQLPEHLRVALTQYARALFITESNQYPPDPQIEMWLSKLVERVVERVMKAAKKLDRWMCNVFNGTQTHGISWHGLTLEEMQAAVLASLDEVRTLTLVRYQSFIEPPQPGTNLPPALPAETVEVTENAPEGMSNPNTEIDRRKRLLEDYKAATGNPSNRRIYEASNSGIYKPEFYQWTSGQLPNKSRVTKRFEAFLKAKKPPIRRKPTT